MLHARVEVSGERVFYEERGEVEGGQDQLLGPLGLVCWLVTSKDPRARLSCCGCLKDVITEVENVYPVVKLAFTYRNTYSYWSIFLTKKYSTVSPCLYAFELFQKLILTTAF